MPAGQPPIFALAALAVAAATAASLPGETDPYYPQFHVRPEQNWINDPNGPMYDARHDKYHLWMQYNPHGRTWGNMSWYHTISDDLVYFKRLGVSLRNAEAYDIGGVFSGSASFVDGAPSPVLSYTCVNSTKAQKQCAAVPANADDAELKDWVKVAGNPLIEHGPEPQNGVINFRDPTEAWRLPNGTYRQAFGTSILPNTAAIALYDTPTLTKNYTFAGLLTATDTFVQPMFECPNYFSVSNFSAAVGPQRFALKVSDMESRQDYFYLGLDSRDGARGETFQQTCYAGVANCAQNPPPGDMNARLVDFGKWYASTTFWDAKRQRRVLWGWINEDWPGYAASQNWAGAQSLPRVLGYDADQRMLTAAPIPELTQLRRDSIVRTQPNGSSLDGLVLNPDPTAAPVWVTTSNALRPQIEVLANFTVSKALFSAGASQIDIGLGVMHDAAAVAAGNPKVMAFAGVVVTNAGATPTTDVEWVGGTYWIGNVAGATAADQISACADLCVRDQRCVAWSFNRTAQTKPCVLKSTFASSSAANSLGWTSGRPASRPIFGLFREESGTVGATNPHVGRAAWVDLDADNYQLELRVFVDRSVVEAFKDGGRERVASRVYNVNASALVSAVYKVQGITPEAANAAGRVVLSSVQAWHVGTIWTKPPVQFHPPSGVAAVLITAAAVGAVIAVLGVFAVRKRRQELQQDKLLPKTSPPGAYAQYESA